MASLQKKEKKKRKKMNGGWLFGIAFAASLLAITLLFLAAGILSYIYLGPIIRKFEGAITVAVSAVTAPIEVIDVVVDPGVGDPVVGDIVDVDVVDVVAVDVVAGRTGP